MLELGCCEGTLKSQLSHVASEAQSLGFLPGQPLATCFQLPKAPRVACAPLLNAGGPRVGVGVVKAVPEGAWVTCSGVLKPEAFLPPSQWNC